MDCTILVFLLISTTTQTTSLHHHCNSDVYSSASGMADLQQLTTLQYCLIDNCTIIRIDTGQQLDIVYTTQSHLVVTPTDVGTSLLCLLLCYALVLKILTYYAQYYAHVKDLCLNFDCFIRIYSLIKL